MQTYLFLMLCWTLTGMVVTVIAAIVAPKSLKGVHGRFRHDIGGLMLVLWPFALLVGLVFLLLWPAKWLVRRVK